jgi:SAM-dependent methyltransferase
VSVRRTWIFLALLTLAGLAPAQTPGSGNLNDPHWLAPFVATPPAIVDALLRLADVSAGDLVYDLGSGDGRIILAAAQTFQARSVGIEWDKSLCDGVNLEIEKLGLEDRTKVIQGDIFDQDVSSATVVTGYLLPKSWERLAPILRRQLKPGARVVSVNHAIPGWRPVAIRRLNDDSTTLGWDIYLYRNPR